MKIPKTPIPCSIDVTPFTFNVTGYAQEYRRATGVSSTARVDTNYADCDCGSQVASRDERVRSCVRACVRLMGRRDQHPSSYISLTVSNSLFARMFYFTRSFVKKTVEISQLVKG